MKEQTQATIGKLHPTPLPRDAIHVAVMSVVAQHSLYPGERVKVIAGTDRVRHTQDAEGGDGVIDPFLDPTEAIHPGDRCWMFLHPNTITSLRHEWVHPTIDDPNPPVFNAESESVTWLRDFAARWGLDYDEMISIAREGNDYIVAGGVDIHSRDELGTDHELFWEHVGRVTGRHYDEAHRMSVGWSCSC